MIEAITGEPYRVWIEREIVEAAGLRETTADMPLANGVRIRARPYLAVSAGTASCHSRRQPGPCDGLGRRVRQHGGRRRPLFRATGAKRETQRAFGRQPPRDDTQTLAQPAWTGGRILRSRNHQRQCRRLGLVRTHPAEFQGYISRTAVIPACDLTVSILTNSIDGWAELWLDGAMQHPASLHGPRRAQAAHSRLDRPLVDHMGRARSRAGRRPRGGRQSARNQSVHGRDGNRGHRARYRPDIVGIRLCKPWRGRSPNPQQGRQRHRCLAWRRRHEAGKIPGGGDGAPIRPRKAPLAESAIFPHFISACTSVRNAWREPSRE